MTDQLVGDGNSVELVLAACGLAGSSNAWAREIASDVVRDGIRAAGFLRRDDADARLLARMCLESVRVKTKTLRASRKAGLIR